MSGFAVARRCGIDLRDRAEEIVRAASRAPSLHNAQPWAFRVGPAEVEVYADWERRVPIADPVDRQLFIGLGAAVLGVRLALARLGLRPVVQLAREPSRPQLAAVVAASDSTDTGEDRELYAQLDRRRTVRGPFTDDAVPLPLQRGLTEVARSECVTARWLVQQDDRRALAAIVLAAERKQRSDPRFRAELAQWTGSEIAFEGAGIPPESVRGAAALAGARAVFALRDFSGGERAPTRPEAHPGVVALSTPTDRRADWLRAGQALHHLLLVATAAGYAASYLNQPLELPDLRTRIRTGLRLGGHPQVILRLGRPAGPLPPATPRRPIKDVLRP
jgi:hypothetical protein